MKIIVALFSEEETGLNVRDIAWLVGVERSTVCHHIDELQESGVVEHT